MSYLSISKELSTIGLKKLTKTIGRIDSDIVIFVFNKKKGAKNILLFGLEGIVQSFD